MKTIFLPFAILSIPLFPEKRTRKYRESIAKAKEEM